MLDAAPKRKYGSFWEPRMKIYRMPDRSANANANVKAAAPSTKPSSKAEASSGPPSVQEESLWEHLSTEEAKLRTRDYAAAQAHAREVAKPKPNPPPFNSDAPRSFSYPSKFETKSMSHGHSRQGGKTTDPARLVHTVWELQKEVAKKDKTIELLRASKAALELNLEEERLSSDHERSPLLSGHDNWDLKALKKKRRLAELEIYYKKEYERIKGSPGLGVHARRHSLYDPKYTGRAFEDIDYDLGLNSPDLAFL
ncbi:hypothetical protein P7C70_g1524, partial [Phenoliferia sp. Uapishka_3]